MKNGPLFFLGTFVALTLSWGGIVLGTHAQLGALTPYYDDGEGNAFPLRRSGVAAQGAQVYQDLGCAACHTQQVRRPGFGSDQARGWGERQSVARDYIFEARPQLGSLRYGPDLANLAARKPSPPDAQDLMNLLYAGSPTHPAYAFLFDTRKIVGERSNLALNLTGNLAPARGHEVVPTARAQALVAYLLSLQQGYQYPEATPLEPAAAAGAAPASAQPAPAPAPAAQPAPPPPGAEGVNTEPPPQTEQSNPPGKRPEQAVPAAAPEEKKKLETK